MIRRAVLTTFLLGVAVTASAWSTPPKRLVLCLDGTWNNPYDEQKRGGEKTDVIKPSNPLKTCRVVVPFDEVSGRIQVTYYATGVGSMAVYPGKANQLLHTSDRALGGAWGAGFERNVEDALSFIVLNYELGDEVFIFGFSRGAATARAVTQFLEWNCGVPEKIDAYYLPVLFRAYIRAQGNPAAARETFDKINNDRRNEHPPFGPIHEMRPVTVKYLGVWETVMALGSRFGSKGQHTSPDARSFYAGTTPAACVHNARQALGVDEHRFDFRPEVWTGKQDGQTMEQRWFAGVHSNIGGGYLHDGLADIAFNWILAGAKEQGLKVDEYFVDFYRPKPTQRLYDSYATIYKVLDTLRFLVGKGRRDLKKYEETVQLDPSVIIRMNATLKELQADDEQPPVTELYRPQNVIDFLADQPDLDAYLAKIGAPKLSPDLEQQVAARRRARRSASGT